MRNANGMGSVYKLPGNRRKPWVAMVTSGYELKDGKARQLRKAIGYYATKKEGQEALQRFNADPYEIGFTFKDVYEKWVQTKEVSEVQMKAYKKAFERFSLVHGKRFDQLTTRDYERLFTLSDATDSGKFNMKVVLNQMYDYALRYDIVQKNIAERFSVKAPTVEKQRVPFTDEEIKTLWESKEPEAKIALIMIYTGVRIGELLTMTIDRSEWLLKGGSKTEAGKNRIVPIRTKIRHLMGFSQEESYNAFYQRNLYFLRKMNHTPHDCRVTFATRYKNADPIAIKLIMGHAIKDVTKGVYTKYTPQELMDVVESIDF